MGAVAILTINDGAASPVARSFVPSRESNEGFIYLDKASGLPVTYNKIVLGTKLPNAASKGERNFRVKFAVHVPIGEVLPDNPNLTRSAYTLRCSGEFVVPERSTLQDRKHLLAFVRNGLAHAVFASLVQDLDSQF